jgi:polyhydroxyalkanoate synthesis regulator phasin
MKNLFLSLSFLLTTFVCAKDGAIVAKQYRTNWAEAVKIENGLPQILPNGVIWEDVFHGDAIDVLIYSYIGKANTNQVASHADNVWSGNQGTQIKSLGFKDIAYLWINEASKREWGLYSSAEKKWFSTFKEYSAARGFRYKSEDEALISEINSVMTDVEYLRRRAMQAKEEIGILEKKLTDFRKEFDTNTLNNRGNELAKLLQKYNAEVINNVPGSSDRLKKVEDELIEIGQKKIEYNNLLRDLEVQQGFHIALIKRLLELKSKIKLN